MAIIAIALSACQPEPLKFAAVDITGQGIGSDFSLVDHNGEKRTLSDFRGKVVLIYFGFTHCPEMCPTALSKMAAVVRGLGADGRNVQGLLITVDPGRDTISTLARYVPAFHPGFLGLYGEEQTIRPIADAFKVYYKSGPKDERGYYTVDHNGGIYAIDRQGRFRLYIDPDTTTVENIQADVKMLLNAS